MIARVLEPELMEEPEQVLAYARADFRKPHNDFIKRLKTAFKQPDFSGTALDLGCGSGDISNRFALAFPNASVDAVDGSEVMIDYALNTVATKLKNRLNFIVGKLPDVSLPKTDYELIFSNSLLHHLPDPQILWQTVKAYGKSGAFVVVMDLLRPRTNKMAKTLVEMYAATEPDILKRDFYQSLLAAFTLDEIQQQLSESQLAFKVAQTSDRHVFISGWLS